jgi:hypothetical protein
MIVQFALLPPENAVSPCLFAFLTATQSAFGFPAKSSSHHGTSFQATPRPEWCYHSHRLVLQQLFRSPFPHILGLARWRASSCLR